MSSLNSQLAVYSKHNYDELRPTEKTRYRLLVVFFPSTVVLPKYSSRYFLKMSKTDKVK